MARPDFIAQMRGGKQREIAVNFRLDLLCTRCERQKSWARVAELYYSARRLKRFCAINCSKKGKCEFFW